MEDLGSKVREFIGAWDEYRLTRDINGWTVERVTWTDTPVGIKRPALITPRAWFADADTLEAWIGGRFETDDADAAFRVVSILDRSYEGEENDDDPLPEGRWQ